MKLLALDPGGTTGYAIFDPKLVLYGSVPEDDFYQWLDLQKDYDLVVCEDYIIDNRKGSGFNHQFNKGGTLQLIGAVKSHCARLNIKLVMQQRGIKLPAAGLVTGKPYKKNQGKNQHQYDAMLHGGFYLMTKMNFERGDLT